VGVNARLNEETTKERLLTIVGPTAAGKSRVAFQLAKLFDTEIITADSMQVYRGMDIGTDKPTPEERIIVKHHLVDEIDISTEYSVAAYQKKARSIISDINARGKIPILAGGTGLYVRAVVDRLSFPSETAPSKLREELAGKGEGGSLFEELTRLDPQAAEKIGPYNVRRIIRALEVIGLTGRPFSSFQGEWPRGESIYDLLFFGLALPREELYRRIEERVDRMIASGLLEETKSLLQQGELSLTARQALGYRQILEYLEGKRSWDETVALIKTRTRQYAKRQLTWFRADRRVLWIDLTRDEPVSFICQKVQEKWAVECRQLKAQG
jgi:tRNA dimethylallyltransferase